MGWQHIPAREDDARADESTVLRRLFSRRLLARRLQCVARAAFRAFRALMKTPEALRCAVRIHKLDTSGEPGLAARVQLVNADCASKRLWGFHEGSEGSEGCASDALEPPGEEPPAEEPPEDGALVGASVVFTCRYVLPSH